MRPDPTQSSPYNETVRAYARDLLGYLNKPGGTVPGGFTTKLFELWGSADFINKIKIAQAWPHIGVVLRANDQGGEAAVRDVAGSAS
jgi:hypothetical protein